MSQTTSVISVTGMSCQHCVAAVTKATKAVAGVSDSVVDLQAATATVTYDPTATTLDAIKAAIVEEGFEAA